ncbi:MAG: LPXTG cell wall anchor domain-containing protein, partial [Qipengyuania citrea]|uniref:LPXTG cell wall anchor domain-containing protein n=2 Tax=Qipengyuania citrea TaxID=225971 RepID=UPI0032988110
MSSAPDEPPSVEDPASDTRAASSVAEPAVPAAPLPDPAANEEGGRTPWLPLAGGAMLLALLGAGFAAWRRRRRRHVPEIQRPVVRSAPPAGPAALGDALRLHVESDKIIR